MTENIRVNCLIDRYWNPAEKEFDGIVASGTLVEISSQSADNDPGTLIPVGIVLMDDSTFQSVPMEFINAIDTL